MPTPQKTVYTPKAYRAPVDRQARPKNETYEPESGIVALECTTEEREDFERESGKTLAADVLPDPLFIELLVHVSSEHRLRVVAL